MLQISHTVGGARLAFTVLAAALLGAPVLVSQQSLPVLARAPAYRPNCGIANQPCQAWAQFRTGHPYPYQSIQWKELPDRRIAIMLLEPPPVMPKADLEKLIRSAFGADLQSYDRFRWQLGIDGWLEDTVLTVTPSAATAGADPLRDPVVRDRVAFLHLALFGTAYGATFDMQKNGLFAGPSEAAPNLLIQPGEVRRWMTDPTVRWQPLGDAPGDALSWQTIASLHMTGAFVTADRSLVLLALPGETLKKAPHDDRVLDPLRVPFRCFAMATDSIAGAFQAANGHTAILGRPRTQSVAAAPPLRFETFKLLASQTANELSQSYERRSLFAGKMSSGDYIYRDWAPIYLSDALIDTEFGALLNTTDQLLKSWSQAGGTEYLNFNYPKPASYPFQTSLLEKVRLDSGNKSVLFNWNTAGSAVMVNTVAGKAFAARQTGALPVTYGAGAKDVETAKLQVDEETAYRYFASRKDANLNRVVQYTLLYQLFRSVSGDVGGKGVAETGDSVPPGQERAVRARREAAAVRVKATLKLLVGIQAGQVRMDPKDKSEFTAKLQRFRAQNPGLASDAQVASIVADRFSDESKKFAAAREKKFGSAEAELEQEIKDFNIKVKNADDSTAPGLKIRKAGIIKRRQELEQLERDNPIDDVRGILEDIASDVPEMDDVRRGIVASYNYEPAGSIKTPSIVVSWDANHIAITGGHNIGARTLKIEPSEKVAGIVLEETESGPVLRYNPSKASMVEAHATELSRAVEHRGVRSAAELEKIIAPPVPIRSRTVALDLPVVAREGSPPDGWSARLGNRLFTAKSQYVDRLSLLAEKSACCEFIGYDDDGIAFATEKSLKPPPATVTYELRDTPSLAAHVEQAAKRGRPLIFLDTPEEHVEALTLHAAGENQGLDEMAALLGKPRSAVVEDRVDGIAGADMNGDVSILKTLANKAEAGARALLDRLTLREPATSWVEAEVRRLDGNEVTRFVEPIGWDARTDGAPTAVMVKFGKANGNGPPIDVSVVAGFADADLPAGRSAVYAIQRKNFALAQAKRESLARYALTVKSEIKRMPQARVMRLMIVVRQGKTQQLLTMREWQDGTLRHAAKHAG
jgi:hypothetical protein